MVTINFGDRNDALQYGSIAAAETTLPYAARMGAKQFRFLSHRMLRQTRLRTTGPTGDFCRDDRCSGALHACEKWWMTLFLVMPDHWHGLVSFQEADGMDKVVRDWKRFIAKATGVRWQDGFFEHRLRSHESANEKWHYIRLNPVRKGLVENPEDWPYVWMPKQVGMALDDPIGRRA